MGWNRAVAAAGIAEVLVGIDPSVSVFASPPETFNPPAYIIGYTRLVNYDEVSFGVDRADLPVLVSGGMAEIDRVDSLLDLAKKALAVDPSCNGTVVSLRVKTQDLWRALSVGGSDVLVAELVLEIRM